MSAYVLIPLGVLAAALVVLGAGTALIAAIVRALNNEGD